MNHFLDRRYPLHIFPRNALRRIQSKNKQNIKGMRECVISSRIGIEFRKQGFILRLNLYGFLRNHLLKIIKSGNKNVNSNFVIFSWN